jgi:hypothetical protein
MFSVIPQEIGLKFKIFSRDQSFIYQSIQILAAFFFSLFLMVYIKNYLQGKKGYKKHVVFQHFIKNYLEFIYANFTCMYPSIAFIALLQVKVFMQKSWDIANTDDLVNASVTICFLLVVFCLFSTNLTVFAPSKKVYSILYHKMDSKNKLTVI